MSDPITTNVAICRALGLNPQNIRRNGVTIELTDIGPVITVEYQKFDTELKVLLEGLQQYKLVPLNADDSHPPAPRQNPT